MKFSKNIILKNITWMHTLINYPVWLLYIHTVYTRGNSHWR